MQMFHKMQMLNILSFRFMLHVLLESWLLGIKDPQMSLSPSITNSEAYRDQKLKGGPRWSFPHPQRWDSISSLKVQLLPSFSRILTMWKYGHMFQDLPNFQDKLEILQNVNPRRAWMFCSCVTVYPVLRRMYGIQPVFSKYLLNMMHIEKQANNQQAGFYVNYFEL